MTSHSRFVSSAHTQRPALTASTLGLATLGLALGCVTGAAPALAQTAATTAGSTTQLPAIAVEGAKTNDSYRVEKSASVKRTETILDTPQSITVVPEKVIQEQAATTLRDVLRNVPGITFGAGEGGGSQGEQLRIRGFSANTDLYVDGIRDATPANNRDPFNLEQVEVVKGASSAYSGAGATGGTVNMVSKAPKMQAFTAGSLSVGTDSLKRVTADVNRPLDNVGIDGTAVRLNVMAHTAGVAGRDEAENERWGVAPSIAFGLGTPTRVTLSALYTKDNNVPDYGLPVLNGVIPPVSRSNWYGVKGLNQEKQEYSAVTFQIEHDASDWITVRNQTRYSESTRFNIVTIPRFPTGTVAFTPSTTVTRGQSGRDTKDTNVVTQTDATLKFKTGALDHSLVTGFDLSHEKYTQRGLTFSGTVAAANLYSPNTNVAGVGWTYNAAATENTGRNFGLYAIDTVKIGPQWEVVGGLRYDNFKADTDTGTATFSLSDNMVSWQGAVIYKPIKTVSLYASASTSYNPSVEAAQSSLSATTVSLKPQENLNYEVGAKWDVIPEKLQLTAAVFRTEKTNVRETDAAGTTVILDGERRVQGIELGVTGNITDKWQVIGGYSYQDSEITKAVRYVGNQMANTPEHTVSLWSTYKLPHDVTVGAGVQYVGERQLNDANTGKLDAYTVVDAMVSYQVTDAIGVQLNAQNLFDEEYFDRAHGGGAHVIPGLGRTVILSTNFRF